MLRDMWNFRRDFLDTARAHHGLSKLITSPWNARRVRKGQLMKPAIKKGAAGRTMRVATPFTGAAACATAFAPTRHIDSMLGIQRNFECEKRPVLPYDRRMWWK